MDSHYDLVMQRRAELERQGAPPRRYFAYSTVLDHAAFEGWSAQHAYGFFQLPEGIVAEALDLDLVYDFPSRWWGGRVAGLADRPGTTVFGRLCEIAGADWPIVQHKEGLITAMCVERPGRLRAGGVRLPSTSVATPPAHSPPHRRPSPRFVAA